MLPNFYSFPSPLVPRNAQLFQLCTLVVDIKELHNKFNSAFCVFLKCFFSEKKNLILFLFFNFLEFFVLRMRIARLLLSQHLVPHLDEDDSHTFSYLVS
jgi:hypothetical protein